MKKSKLKKNDTCPIVTGIGPITDELVNNLMGLFDNDAFKTKIANSVIDPVTDVINQKIRPYIAISIGMYLVIVILLIIIITLLSFTRGHFKKS